MKQLIIIIGLPGSGKDTQIELLAKLRKIEIIRIGDLIRQRATTDQTVRQALEAGDLVDYGIVNEMIQQQLESFADGSVIISDGFPRDVDQAKWVEEYAQSHDINVAKYLLIDISDEESLQRLLKRGRHDDSQTIIQNRIAVFHRLTDEVISHAKEQGIFVAVDGAGDPLEISQRIKTALQW